MTKLVLDDRAHLRQNFASMVGARRGMMIEKLIGLQAEAKKRFLAAQAAGEIHKSYALVGISANERGISAVAESGDGNVSSPGFATSYFLVIPAGDDCLGV